MPFVPNQRTSTPMLLRPLAGMGASFTNLVRESGAMAIFLLDGLARIPVSVKQIPKIVSQMYFVGVKSLFVIALIGLFTGMVLGLQGYYTLIKFGSEGMLGALVSLSLIRELGPVLAALMITGRAGSSMAAELGVMRISDQIDALTVMDIHPMSFLVAPRLAACIICFPLLTAIFDVIGILGGYLSGVVLMGINQGIYFHRIETSVEMVDIMGGFYKSLAFALIMGTVCCFQGYFTHMRTDGQGAEGVSNSTTSAVVLTSVLVLVSDYVLTSFLL